MFQKLLKKEIAIKVLFMGGVILLAGALVIIGLRSSNNQPEPRGIDHIYPTETTHNEFVVLDENDQKIDYRKEYLSDGKIDSVRERIFSMLDQDLTDYAANKNYPQGEMVYAISQSQTGAVAIFNFAEDKKIYLENYIESPLFDIPIIRQQLIDLNNDGYKDLFILSHSGNYLDIERPWFFLNQGDDYALATPLEPIGVDVKKSLSGEIPAQNAMEIRAHAGVDPVWLRDLNNDRVLEVITLDNETFSDEEGLTEVTKRVYGLEGGVYSLKETKILLRRGTEENEIRSWPRVPEAENI